MLLNLTAVLITFINQNQNSSDNVCVSFSALYSTTVFSFFFIVVAQDSAHENALLFVLIADFHCAVLCSQE